MVAYAIMPGRRKIGLENVRRIYHEEKTEGQLKRIVRQSATFFLLGIAENVWFRHALGMPGGIKRIRTMIPELDAFAHRAKMIHDQTGGCIFITPHLGCYTLLPYLFSAIGIPLTVPIQEMGNDLLQRRWCPLNEPGSLGGQIFVAKRNSMNLLRKALRSGQSVGMMADQRTMRGLAVEFLGATAAATPIPAMLAVGLKRPIVIGACCRDRGGSHYKLLLREPIWADQSRDAKEEIARLTQELNHKMGEMIRDYPEQYLWMHNRWKTYRVRRNRAISLSSPAAS
jgi:KDO2-lipid IV(A) lauroyltransferase